MKRQPLVLAISNADDRQLEMLSEVPHVLVRSVDDLTEEAKQAEAILHWAGSRELLRQAFVSSACAVGSLALGGTGQDTVSRTC